MLKIARRNTLEVCANAAQFGRHKTINKMHAPIQASEQLVLYLIVDRKRDLRTIWPNLRKINDSHQLDIPASRFERILIRRVALDRQKDRVSLEPKWTAKTEIDCLGGSYRPFVFSFFTLLYRVNTSGIRDSNQS